MNDDAMDATRRLVDHRKRSISTWVYDTESFRMAKD